LIAALAVVPEEGLLSAVRAGYLQRLPAVAAPLVVWLDCVSTFWTSEGADRVDLATERADIVVRRDEFAAVPAWVFVSGHV